MDVNWGSPATLSRRKTLSCCSANWIGTCRRNLHPGSRKRVNGLRSKSWCRPFGVEGVCSGTYAFLPAPVAKVRLTEPFPEHRPTQDSTDNWNLALGRRALH